MQKIRFFIGFGLCVLLCQTSFGQDALNQKISISAYQKSIESVLFDIEDRYQIYFTYSRNSVPVTNRITLDINSIALKALLDELFKGTAIVYREMHGRVLLKVDPDKAELLALIAFQEEQKRREELRRKEEEKRKREVLISNRRKEQEKLKLNPINSKKSKMLENPGGSKKMDIDWSKLQLSVQKNTPPPQADTAATLEMFPEMKEVRLAQVSIFPFVGTNKLESNEVVNNFSLNIFWGTNGGLDGIEVGGFFNHLQDKGVGLQVAGLGNTVGNRFVGTQAAGLFNITGGALDGVQGAGFFNIAKNANAVQGAGFFNIASQRFSGLQAAGVFNVAKADGPAIQIAGLLNANKGKVQTQISGLMNFSGDVSGGQVTSLLNVAKKVEGLQFALINVADTIAGTPIGLLNFIKNGYNRVEFSVSETFFGNFALRIGVKQFYNILYMSGRFDRSEIISNGSTSEELALSWGLGYGIGTGITFGSRFMINLEAMAIHVNELESWTNELNLLNQFKLGFDIRTGNRTSIFFGPTFNIMTSKLTDSESNIIGSNIMPYTFYDQTNGDTNVKMWVGVSAGIRI